MSVVDGGVNWWYGERERERESIRVVLLVGRDCLRGIDVENNGWRVCEEKKRGWGKGKEKEERKMKIKNGEMSGN